MVARHIPLLFLIAAAQSAAAAITASQVKAAAAAASNVASHTCCLLLSAQLGNKTSFPSSDAYDESIGSYWSVQNNDIDPACIVSPTATNDVSLAVGILRAVSSFGVQCQFAVRGGGHTPWAGAATIENGVVIDLSAMGEISVSTDRKTTSVGGGARWIDAYLVLDTLGLAISGGRVASVGVGGLTTGGGVSFFAPQVGLVCDNVVNFEVVLADGIVVNANRNDHSDLWYALKGGSNNFGIVTRFDFHTFAQGHLWGGSIVYPSSTIPDQLAAFVNFTNSATYDPNATIINSYGYSPAAKESFVSNYLMYTAPVVSPPAFEQFTSIQPQLLNSLRTSNLSDFALELNVNTAYGFRQIFYTRTYANDLTLLTQLVAQLNESMQPVNGLSSLNNYALSLEPLPTTITKWASESGGNALGLNPSDGDLVLVLLSVTWADEADDEVITNSVTDLFTKVDAFAASSGTLNPYIYLNYAYETQRPIESYGANNVKRLQAASRKYDPWGAFQELVPGGFKLFGL